MANTDFSVLLKAVLDKSGINTELQQVQEIVKKYSIDIIPELKTASLRNQMKAVSKDIANDFNKTLGTNLTGNDVFKAFENQAKAIKISKKEQEALTAAMAKGREQAEALRMAEEKRQQKAQNAAINKALEQEYLARQKNIEAMARGREKIEAARKAEEKRQQTAQNKAINKALEDEWKERQRNIETSKKQAEADRKRAGNIALGVDTGMYDAKIQSLIAKTRQWTDANGNAKISTTNLQTALQGLNVAYNNLNANGGNTEANQRALIEAERLLGVEIQKTTAQINSQNAQFATNSSVDTLRAKYESFYANNSAAHKRWGAQLKAAMAELATGSNVPIERLQQLNSQLLTIQSTAKATGLTGASMWDRFTAGIKKYQYYFSSMMLVMYAYQGIKNMITNVRDLDTALVDLRKTTTMTKSQLEDFYYSANETAKQMGVTTKEIIDQASAWSRLGYSSQAAATKMAKYSSMFASISPGMSTDLATDGLVSVMKAFDIGNNNPDEVLDGIISKINVIGNTAATSNDEIVEMLTRSSSAMREANNTLEETIALETAAVEITRDAESVGTAFKTVSMRLRGYDEETESYSNNVAQLAGDIADLTKTASKPGGISLFTDSSKTEFKSTYQIIKDISEIYDELTDKQQADLLEAIAGKRQGQVVAAAIQNFEAAERALDSMADSAGSAEREMAVIMDSVDYKANKLKETGVSISQNLFQRDDMKNILDALTKLAEVLDWVTEKAGLLGTIGLGAGLFAGIKNVGINMLVAYLSNHYCFELPTI